MSVTADVPESIVVSVGSFEPGPTAEGPNVWGHHVIRYQNTGDVDVHFDDSSTAQLIGDPTPTLLVGDEGCDYVPDPNDDEVTPVCQLNLLPFTVPAGGTVEFTMTLWRDLPGMAPLESGGSYRFVKPVRFTEQVQPSGDPDWSTLVAGSVEVTYAVR